MISAYKRIVFLFIILTLTSACKTIFESDEDFLSQKVLHELAEIQQKYHTETGKYASTLREIAKYNLKYDNGVVYLEFQEANKDDWRAIALPAESVTARVFAFDTKQGGFYEMDEEEVSKYVLGSLNHIRADQKKKNINDWTSRILLGLLLFFGIKLYFRYNQPVYRKLFITFFFTLVPAGWSLAVVNHMKPDTIFSSVLLIMTFTALVISVLSLGVNSWWVSKNTFTTPGPIMGMVASTLLIAFLSLSVQVFIFARFY
ncbi:MAG: hypothetical protein COV66_00855 [Nitrospinae bacterium CG11_big_fil_rev_8_21_14_0_20_45_15]|nr:MAG: hypothetical protein COV66_00855 [Nitrospinae bacterium CG11_big_fil_rev_8_21_14_0_20_45_15]